MKQIDMYGSMDFIIFSIVTLIASELYAVIRKVVFVKLTHKLLLEDLKQSKVTKHGSGPAPACF